LLHRFEFRASSKSDDGKFKFKSFNKKIFDNNQEENAGVEKVEMVRATMFNGEEADGGKVISKTQHFN